MSKIESILAREILDSRGNPTVYATVVLEGGAAGSASVPSGASTGSREAVELRDGDAGRYGGRGVLRAVGHVRGEIGRAVRGLDASCQRTVDNAMAGLDGTPDLSRLGANAILAVSLANLRAAAADRGVPVYRHFAGLAGFDRPAEMPVPMFNILNGGAHASGSTDFQEFMVVPAGCASFQDAVRAGSEIYHALKGALESEHFSTNLGDEGGFAPAGLTTRRALGFIVRAVEEAGYRPGADAWIALDPAASEFYDQERGLYDLKREGLLLSTAEMVDEYASLARQFPIYSIEDGLAEDDWAGWAQLTARLGDTVQIVGDDLLVTNPATLQRAIREKAANAVLVKPNQAGTVSRTLETMLLAKSAGFGTVVSHRSGETEDTTIADLAAGALAGQIKAGAPARGERVAKYNRLLHIEAELGDAASFYGTRAVRRA